MAVGETDELVHVWLDGVHAALHGGDGVALPLKADALTPLGTEAVVGKPGGSAAMQACQVAAKDEDLVWFQFRYHFGCIFSAVHNMIIYAAAKLRNSGEKNKEICSFFMRDGVTALFSLAYFVT